MKYWNSGKEKVDITRFDMDVALYDTTVFTKNSFGTLFHKMAKNVFLSYFNLN